MAHLLVIVLLIVFGPIALATIAPLLAFVVRVAIALICAPFMLIYSLYRAPGAICRGIRQDIGKTAEFGFLKNLGGAIAICAIITLLLMPLFPT